MFSISICWSLLCEFNITQKIFTFPLPLLPKSMCIVTYWCNTLVNAPWFSTVPSQWRVVRWLVSMNFLTRSFRRLVSSLYTKQFKMVVWQRLALCWCFFVLWLCLYHTAFRDSAIRTCYCKTHFCCCKFSQISRLEWNHDRSPVAMCLIPCLTSIYTNMHYLKFSIKTKHHNELFNGRFKLLFKTSTTVLWIRYCSAYSKPMTSHAAGTDSEPAS